MLHESVLKLYRRLRLDGYRKLFGAVQEREGSLSAMEAFSADLINLLGEPTLKAVCRIQRHFSAECDLQGQRAGEQGVCGKSRIRPRPAGDPAENREEVCTVF